MVLPATFWTDLWAGGLIGFREALEAMMIVVVFMLILRKSGRADLIGSIWKGVALGIAASIITALVFEFALGSFAENEAWFEGTLMVASSILIAVVILHLIKHQSKQELESIATGAMSDSEDGVRTLSFIAFLSVWREGSETVVFLSAGTETSWALLGLGVGITMAVLIGWSMHSKGARIDIHRLFSITTVLLLFVGAGLAGHGVHELQEEGLIPIIDGELWDVNPEWDSTGSPPLLHDKGAIGGLFRATFGWNGDPTLLEFFSWLTYLGLMGALVKRDTEAHTPAEGGPADSSAEEDE